MTYPQRLRGHVAIVMGAGSVTPGWGNGRACAVQYAREGACVMVVDKDSDAAHVTAEIIENEGGSCEVARLDVLDYDATVNMVAECRDKFGGAINILHCNVGAGLPGGPLDMTVAQFKEALDLNVTSAFIGCKAVLPYMVKQ